MKKLYVNVVTKDCVPIVHYYADCVQISNDIVAIYKGEICTKYPNPKSVTITVNDDRHNGAS